MFKFKGLRMLSNRVFRLENCKALNLRNSFKQNCANIQPSVTTPFCPARAFARIACDCTPLWRVTRKKIETTDD